MQVPLRINKCKDNDDIFPMQQEREQWEREVEDAKRPVHGVRSPGGGSAHSTDILGTQEAHKWLFQILTVWP